MSSILKPKAVAAAPTKEPPLRMHFVLVRVLEHWFVPFRPGSETEQAMTYNRAEAERWVKELVEKYHDKGFRTVTILVA
jgi:hypothetical protein